MADHRRPIVRHVAIIGAGFSGSLLAINLLRHDGPRATLIERRADAGRGVAYSAAHPDHLLNVRAGNMSALPDDPAHFTRWLAARHPQLGGFVPRIVYGDYLGDLLADAQARAPDRLRLVKGDAVAVETQGDGVRVTLRTARSSMRTALCSRPAICRRTNRAASARRGWGQTSTLPIRGRAISPKV